MQNLINFYRERYILEDFLDIAICKVLNKCWKKNCKKEKFLEKAAATILKAAINSAKQVELNWKKQIYTAQTNKSSKLKIQTLVILKPLRPQFIYLRTQY